MEAVGALLRGLPLQPEDSDRVDLMEAKSELFSKYFMLFMNLINYCNEPSSSEDKDVVSRQSPTLATSKLATLRNTTIQAMSNLLSANIDSGLRHSIRTQKYQINSYAFNLGVFWRNDSIKHSVEKHSYFFIFIYQFISSRELSSCHNYRFQ